jgi:hypothetical protein
MNKRPSIEVVKQEMEEQRRLQAGSIDSLDTKIGITVGFTGVILTLYAEKVSINDVGNIICSPVVLLSLLGLLFLLFSLLFSILAFWVRSFRFDPSPNVLKDDYMFRDPDNWSQDKAGSKEQIVVDQVEAYNRNQETLNKKARRINLSVTFLGFGILILIIVKLLRGGL